jgi:hypothetical protein
MFVTIKTRYTDCQVKNQVNIIEFEYLSLLFFFSA